MKITAQNIGSEIKNARNNYHQVQEECQRKIDEARQQMRHLETGSLYHDQRIEAGIYR